MDCKYSVITENKYLECFFEPFICKVYEITDEGNKFIRDYFISEEMFLKKLS